MNTHTHFLRILLEVTAVMVAVVTLASCRTTKSIDKHDSKVDSVIVEKRVVDTMLITEADTATLRLLAECDEHGNALLSIINAMNGERVNVTPEIRYIPVKDTTGMVRRDALIDIQAVAEQLTQKVYIQEEQIKKYKKEIHDLNEEKSQKPVFSFNSFMWGTIAGFILGLMLLGYVLYKTRD